MTDSMKAIVYHGPKDIRLESIAVPPVVMMRFVSRLMRVVYGTNLKTHLHGNPRIKAT